MKINNITVPRYFHSCPHFYLSIQEKVTRAKP